MPPWLKPGPATEEDGFTALYHPVYEDVRVATVQYGNFAFSLTEWNDEPQWNS